MFLKFLRPEDDRESSSLTGFWPPDKGGEGGKEDYGKEDGRKANS
jgi:hypothetical protein